MIFKIFSLKAIEQRIYRFILQTTNKNNKKVFILCIMIENIVKHMFLIPEGVVLLTRTSKYSLRFKKIIPSEGSLSVIYKSQFTLGFSCTKQVYRRRYKSGIVLWKCMLL